MILPPTHGSARVIYELVRRGYPTVVAMRVACTGHIALTGPTRPHRGPLSQEPRPGREIAEAVDGNLGKVVRLVVAQIGGAP